MIVSFDIYFVTDCDGFTCDVTKCIPLNEVCDGVDQCDDKTDEQHNCPTGQLSNAFALHSIVTKLNFNYYVVVTLLNTQKNLISLSLYNQQHL